MIYGHFPHLVLKIADSGYAKQDVFVFIRMALCMPRPLWQRTSYVQRGHTPTSFVPPVHTRVSAQLLEGVMPHGINSCRLLAHYLLSLITVCSSMAPFGGRLTTDSRLSSMPPADILTACGCPCASSLRYTTHLS